MSYSNVSQITTYISYKLNTLCKNLNHSYNARGQSALQAACSWAGYLKKGWGKAASLVNKAEPFPEVPWKPASSLASEAVQAEGQKAAKRSLKHIISTAETRRLVDGDATSSMALSPPRPLWALRFGSSTYSLKLRLPIHGSSEKERIE